MQVERSLIKKILYVIKGLGTNEIKMSGIELVKNEDGTVIGYNIEIRTSKPNLRIVPDDD